jgi:hypothetical protein
MENVHGVKISENETEVCNLHESILNVKLIGFNDTSTIIAIIEKLVAEIV